MSTFLEMVQDLHRESGASGQSPTTVENPTGETRRLVRWIQGSNEFIQKLYINWKFLRKEDNRPLTPSNAFLSKPNDLSWWDEDTFFLIEEGTTEKIPLEVVEYDKIKGEILDTSEDIPFRVIIMPDNNLQFEPVPNGAHTFLADYYIKPVKIVNNSDISIVPEQFHNVIVGRALVLYANYENAPEIKTQGQEVYSEFLARLENDQLPNQFNARFRTGGFFEVIGSQ